jgi:hypothetical protein
MTWSTVSFVLDLICGNLNTAADELLSVFFNKVNGNLSSLGHRLTVHMT